MKPAVKIIIDAQRDLLMRSVNWDDVELLRIWKNDHREFFFHKTTITEEQQKNWFAKWFGEKNDHLFMVECKKEKVGCIGARLFNNTVDVYNVILGDKSFKGSGVMSEVLLATLALCNFLYPGKPVCVRVLKNNPATGWYRRNGFVQKSEGNDFVTMEWEGASLKTYECELSICLPF